MENGLTHFDKEGNAVMVDVSGKNVTYRTALATGYIAVGPEIMACVTEGNVKKGDVLGVARMATNSLSRRLRLTPLSAACVRSPVVYFFSILIS